MARRDRSGLMTKVLIKLGETKLVEANLVDRRRTRGYLWEGLYEGGVIYVNPAWGVADTLIHEALHALYPHWSERVVRAQTTRLIGELTGDMAWEIWRRFKREGLKPDE